MTRKHHIDALALMFSKYDGVVFCNVLILLSLR